MGNGRRRDVPCAFCQERTFTVFNCTQRVGDRLRIQKTALCPKHLVVLMAAGDRGRVHGAIGAVRECVCAGSS